MEPLTPLETLCRIILRAREYEAQVPTDYDGGEAPDNVDDEDEGSAVGPRRHHQHSVEEELNAIARGSRRGPAGRSAGLLPGSARAPMSRPTGTRRWKKPAAAEDGNVRSTS